MLINQTIQTTKRPVTRWALLSLTLLIFTGCATQKAHKHDRARFSTPPPIDNLPPSDVPYGKTDWKAVVESLNGPGKKATQLTRNVGGYSRNMWDSTGGRLMDTAAGRQITSAPGAPSNCGYLWPANGKISRGFRPASNHKGLDITAPTGTPIFASRAGRVIYSSNELSGFGNCIIIQHDPEWTTFYAHNNRNFVRPGDIVQAGQPIAEVGKTGRATGPHLHFEIRSHGTALDPHPMLP